MKVFVTGATGLIGSRLVQRLLNGGHEVSVLVRENSGTSAIDTLELRRFTGDITRHDTLTPALESIEVVFHVAGLVRQWRGYSDDLYRVNVLGVRNVLNACLTRKVRKVVLVSSTAAVGTTAKPEIIDEIFPFNNADLPYSQSKWLGEQEARKVLQKGLDVVIVNPATVFGPGDRHLNACRTLINVAKGKYFGYPPGGTTVVDVEDIVSGMIAACEKGRTGERYILGNEHLSFRAMLEQMAQIVGVNPPRIQLPSLFIKTTAYSLELMSFFTGKEPYPSRPAAELSVRYLYASSAKARAELGYTPRVDFRQSISNTCQWCKEAGLITA